MGRDFANGYLFAEILHRYFPGEVSMHSFDKNASSVHKKRDNWSVLLKPLKKAGFDVATREWEAICAAEDGAAVEFVGKMHRRLAGGSAPARPPSGADGGSRRTSARRGGGDDRGGRERGDAENLRERHDGFSGRGSWEGEVPARGRGDDRGASRSGGDEAGGFLGGGGWGRGYEEDAPRDDADFPRGGAGAPPSKFRFQPGASGGFDWEAYQREYMSPQRDDRESERWLEVRPGSAGDGCGPVGSRDDDDVDDARGSPRRRPMRPLRDRDSADSARHSDTDRYDSWTPPPRREPRRNRAPGGFDGGASLLDWGPSLPGEEEYYGEADGYDEDGYGYDEDGDGYDSAGRYDDRRDDRRDYDSAGGRGRSTRRAYARDADEGGGVRRARNFPREEADGASRERRYREASGGARRREEQGSASRASRKNAFRERRDSAGSSFVGEKSRGAAPGFYNPTFYERKYDLGEARGVSTYERSGAGGYHGARERPSEAQLRARSEGPFAGQYGMDYEPKRASEYRRMLGEDGGYLKLGSLGGDLDTEAQRVARERREAVKELDRINREQNRLAAERSAANLAKKRGDASSGGSSGSKRTDVRPGGAGEKRLERGFLSHVGDRDPRNPGKNRAPSKHERMWSYAKRHIPKPVPAPPKKVPPAPPRIHGVWKEPASSPEAFAGAPEDENFRGEWPSAWGGREEAKKSGPHRNASRVDRGRRGMQLQPDAMHDRGAAREMSELERLEMEHRIHQQKLRELSLV